MGWFSRKIRVSSNAVILDWVEKAFSSKRDDLKQALQSSGQQGDADEIAIYAAWQPLLSMTLAGVAESVRYGYAEACFSRLEEGTQGLGKRTEERFAEYSATFGADVAQGKAHLAPTMIGTALRHIVGASDESVVAARLALLMAVHKVSIEVDSSFFHELKIVQ